MSVAEAVSHELNPVPANFDAPWNVLNSDVVLPTFHPVRSAFISLASSKVEYRVVVEAVSHELNPVPVNLDAR